MASKKFTINTLMESIPEVNKTDVKLEGEYFKDVVVQVRRTLPLEDAMNFVKDITATCIDDEQAEFMPELFDFAVRMYVVMYYANVDLSKDVKKAYRILYDTTLFEQVYAHVNTAQSTNLILSAEKRIEHWKNILSSSLAGKVSEMLRKMEDVMAGSEEMMAAIDGDEFKAAVARLSDSGVLKTNEPSVPAELNDSITESVTPDDVAKATELMAGLMPQNAPSTPGNVVYMKKKK